MNNLKSGFVYLLLLVFLATRPSIAFGLAKDLIPEDEYDNGDYIVLSSGEEAPYDGFLFDANGLANVIANKNFQLNKLRIEKDAEISKLNLQLDTLKKQHDLELRINKELNTNLLNIKDSRIQQLEDSKKWDDVKLFGSMLLGMALSVTIFYAAVKITNVTN